MPSLRQSDFLQKLSSSTTPLNGCVVPTMDKIIKRELDGRCLDEGNIPSRRQFSNLYNRLFPSLRSSNISPSELNRKYEDVMQDREAASQITRTPARRGLRPRKIPPKKKLRHPPCPNLYDIKTKRWLLDEFQQKRMVSIENAINHQFVRPKPPALYTAGNELASSALDAPAPEGEPLGHRDETEKTDTEESISSSDAGLRKGAAYDGDSSGDLDYVQGNHKEKTKKQSRPVPPEARWSALLNAIAATTAIIVSESPPSPGRWWYGLFSTQKLPAEEGETHWNRKPDFVLLGGEPDLSTWKNLKAIGELTISDLKNNTTLIKTLSTKAYILLCSQPWRRYVLTFSIARDYLRIHLFDRSGIVVSPPLNLHTEFPDTCRIFHAFAHADNAMLGYDPTLEIYPPDILQQSSPPAFIGYIIIDGQTYDIVFILWSSNRFVGRCTNTYHVRPRGAPPWLSNGELDDYDFVIKDCWLEEHLVDHEQMILEHLSGTDGVPTLVKAWTVQHEGVIDTTLQHRPSQWDPNLTPRFTPRIHRRLLMNPVGSPLSSFRSQRELLHGLIEGLEIHERLVTQKSVLHRDISPNNMIFKRSAHPDHRPLFLIDFDYSLRLDGGAAQYPKGTGTLPFVSISILQQATEAKDANAVVHEVADDLESFFYVFIWICVLHTGPNGALFTAEGQTSIVHEWSEVAMASGGLFHALSVKSMFIHAPNDIIAQQFTPYFQNLTQLGEEWRALVEAEDKRRNMLRKGQVLVGPSAGPLTHATVIHLMHRHLDTLPADHDASPQIRPDTPPLLDRVVTQSKRPPPSPSSTTLAKKTRNA